MKMLLRVCLACLLLALSVAGTAAEAAWVQDGYSVYRQAVPEEAGYVDAGSFFADVTGYAMPSIVAQISGQMAIERSPIERYLDYENYCAWLIEAGYTRSLSYARNYYDGHVHVYTKGAVKLLTFLNSSRAPFELTVANLSGLPDEALEELVGGSYDYARKHEDRGLMAFKHVRDSLKATSQYGFEKLMGTYAPKFSQELTLEHVYETLGVPLPEKPSPAVAFPNPYQLQREAEMVYLSGNEALEAYIQALRDLGFQRVLHQTLGEGRSTAVFEIYSREPEEGRVLLVYDQGDAHALRHVLTVTDLSDAPYYAFIPLYEAQGAAHPFFEYRLNGMSEAVITRFKYADYPMYADLVVPDVLDGYPVVGIDDHAFQHAKHVRTIRLGCKLKQVQPYAFAGVEGAVLIVPSRPSSYIQAKLERQGRIRVDSYVADDAETTDAPSKDLLRLSGNYRYEMLPDGSARIVEYLDDNSEHVDLPAHLDGIRVSTIGVKAFANASLHSIHLPEGLQRIEEAGFSDCRHLARIHLPSSLKVIDDEAFAYCLSLSDVQLPPGLEYIGARAFESCGGLERLVLPDGLQHLGRHALIKSGVKALVLPASLRDLGGHPYSDLSDLQESFQLSIHPGNLYLSIHADALFQVEQAKLIFHMHPHGLTEYTVPDGTRAIMPGVFPGPDGYVSVSPLSVLHLPDSLTDVPSLFLNSSRLTEVNLPASLEFLGETPFGIQNAVDEVLFPDTPPYIAVIRGDGLTIAREIRVNFESPSYRLLLEMGCTNLVDSREE